MEKRKIVWAVRGILYKFYFGRFGNMSYIGKPVSIVGSKNIYIQDKVRIYPGVRMETNNGGSIVIHENTSIAQNFHITSDGEELIIGKNTTILGNVFITNVSLALEQLFKRVPY